MNSLLPIQKENASALTMSSREIAELCGKLHKNVIYDIRKMLDELEMSWADFSAEYKTADGRMQPCFNLPKDLTLTLIAGYNVKLRKRIIDRWQELENQQKPTALLPQNYLEALEKLVETEKERQALALENQAMKPKADFVDLYVDIGTTKSLRETAKILNMPEKAMIAALERDKALYRQSGNLIPYSDKQSRGLFAVKTGTAEHGHNFTQTRVTAKGIQWIANRYASELML